MANESVLFKRGDSATITSTPVIDGQILFDTSGNGKMYLDNGTDRLEMGGAVTVDASLSKTSTNAVQNKAVTGNILNSLKEVSAATQQNTIAGALALKEANSVLKETNSNLGGCSFEQEGNDFYITGADSVRKKLGRTGTIAGVAVYFDDPPHSVLKTWQGGCVKWDGDKLIVTVEDDYAQGHLTVGTVIGKRNRPQTWGDTTEGFFILWY
jgi:hypothetical protein